MTPLNAEDLIQLASGDMSFSHYNISDRNVINLCLLLIDLPCKCSARCPLRNVDHN